MESLQKDLEPIETIDPVFEVMKSTGTSMEKAIEAIEKANGDIVDAILFIMKPNYAPISHNYAKIDMNSKNQKALKNIAELRKMLKDINDKCETKEEKRRNELNISHVLEKH